MRGKELLILVVLTLGALGVHGYHPAAEDAEIYLPTIVSLLHPQLFPFHREFFHSHSTLTLFPQLIAWSVKLTHLPLSVMLLAWQVASIFLVLLACYVLARRLFQNGIAAWGGVILVAALLTLPVAGTSLYIMDHYINPRHFSAFAAIFSILAVLEGRYLRAGLWLAFAAMVHPLMAFYAISYSVLLGWMGRRDRTHTAGVSRVGAAFVVPFRSLFQAPSPAYLEATRYHPALYLLNWRWYEWLGIVAPLVLLAYLVKLARARRSREVELLCRALVVYELVYFAGALVISIPTRFAALARVQPLRALHLLYLLLFVLLGGLAAEYVLDKRIWRWIALYVPLCAGMFAASRATFPASAHIEWPGAAPKNAWVASFEWVRENTPSNALFALDPMHMCIRGEDANGFRAVAERSMLADAVKDSGAVTMFPPLAQEWLEQVQAQTGWKDFRVRDFERLRARYGVEWVILQQPGISAFSCPYQNRAVVVCHVD